MAASSSSASKTRTKPLPQGKRGDDLGALKWFGLAWDEGPDVGGPHGPYKQSQRLPLYKKEVERLVAEGKAYRCFCTVARLEELRKTQTANKLPPGYDRRCRELSPEEGKSHVEKGTPHTIRFRSPREGKTIFRDELRGNVEFENKGLDDLVLLKADGFPTYHLASVVDDHHMQITDVIRGEEWVSSTPKHVLLYEAFGWERPTFTHLNLLRNLDKSKISKRKNPTSMLYYRRKGILPEALRNFLALMGWSPGGRCGDFHSRSDDREFHVEPLFAWRADLRSQETSVDEQPLFEGPVGPGVAPAAEGNHFSDDYLLKIIPLVKERVQA